VKTTQKQRQARDSLAQDSSSPGHLLANARQSPGNVSANASCSAETQAFSQPQSGFLTRGERVTSARRAREEREDRAKTATSARFLRLGFQFSRPPPGDHPAISRQSFGKRKLFRRDTSDESFLTEAQAPSQPQSGFLSDVRREQYLDGALLVFINEILDFALLNTVCGGRDVSIILLFFSIMISIRIVEHASRSRRALVTLMRSSRSCARHAHALVTRSSRARRASESLTVAVREPV
jgi:hypothetical protein